MSYQLKDQFGPSAPRAIAAMIRAVHARFPHDAFLADALAGYGPLALTARGQQVAAALHRHLPADYPLAVDILLQSARQPHDHQARGGMAAFLYPFVLPALTGGQASPDVARSAAAPVVFAAVAPFFASRSPAQLARER